MKHILHRKTLSIPFKLLMKIDAACCWLVLAIFLDSPSYTCLYHVTSSPFFHFISRREFIVYRLTQDFELIWKVVVSRVNDESYIESLMTNATTKFPPLTNFADRGRTSREGRLANPTFLSLF